MARKNKTDRNQENALLKAEIEKEVADVTVQYNKAMAIKNDPAKQILALNNLQYCARYTASHIERQARNLVSARAKEGAKHTGRTYAKRAAVMAGYATGVGALVIWADILNHKITDADRNIPPLNTTSQKSESDLEEKERNALYAAIGFWPARDKLYTLAQTAHKLEADLIEKAPLRELARSADFEALLKGYPSLRERFTAAGISAHKEDPQQKAPATATATPRRTVGSYKNLIDSLS